MLKSPWRSVQARRRAFELAHSGAPETYIQKVLGIDSANLIAYWPMNEAAGAVSINAQGVTARNGAYTGVTLGQPGIGDGNTCPLFNTGYNNIYSLSLDTAFNNDEGTLAGWAKVSNVGAWTNGIAGYSICLSNGAFSEYAVIRKSSGNNRLDWIYRVNGVNYSIGKTPISDLGWMHLALTWSVSANEVKAYFNGVQEGVTLNLINTWQITALANNRTLIGARITNPLDVWNGNLAHSAVWTIALNAPQIAELATV